jgi:hypothetical protein
MALMIHVEIRVRRSAIADPMLRTDEIHVVALVDQEVPKIVPVALEPLARLGD